MIRHGSAGGFTLLEVLAALLIAAVALAYLLESQIAGIRLANATRELRLPLDRYHGVAENHHG